MDVIYVIVCVFMGDRTDRWLKYLESTYLDDDGHVVDDLDDDDYNFSVDPIASYSELEDAMYWSDRMQEISDSLHGKNTRFYDIIELQLDEKPALLNFYEEEVERTHELVEKVIKDLMNKGYLDQLIGEDGEFYYTETEKGKREISSLPDAIKKIIDKKKKQL